MDGGALDPLLTITATHRAHAWQIAAAMGALVSFVPVLWATRVRRVRMREARLLAVGIGGAAAGAALLPMLLRAPAAIATKSLAPLVTGDRMAIGALLGFAAAVALAARCRGLAPLRALDRLAPSMGVLVVLGRVGCFLEGCDFGSVTRAPWAITYPAGSHAFEHQLARGMVRATDVGSLPVHPAQLYEAIVGAAMIAAALLVLRAQRARRALGQDGAALRAAMATYAVGRIVVEVFRGDDRGALGPLSTPQWMAFALLAWAAGGFDFAVPRNRATLRAVPWVHAFLRGSKVFARADERGALLAEGGRVEVRYKPHDGRKYGARADNLTIVDGRVLPEDTCGPASSVADAKSAKASAATAAGETEAGATGAAAPPARATRAASGARSTAKRTPKASAAAHTHEDDHAHAGDGAVIHVYADGACSGNPGPAGLGVVVLDTESRIELSEYIGQGTNNIAELTAILRALGELADSERPMVIHTDSSYSIGVLQKGWKAKANQELIAELRDVLKRRGGVRLVYVPGHAGVAWNERADSLARAAVQSRKTTRHVVRSHSAAPRV